MKSARLVALHTREARLKRKLRAHLKDLGYRKTAEGVLIPPALDKSAYRNVHGIQRLTKLVSHQKWIGENLDSLKQYFASGNEINVRAIKPRLELAPGQTWQGDLFRLAGLSWQIPISEGYGRRLRFLVWDDSNHKLIGILALGDAVFNLRARDEIIGWDHNRRAEALVNLMDAYVLGSIPPYNAILGGKLIASLLRTKEVVDAFNNKYKNSIGVISKVKKSARLAAITTTSALGRSSIYNRVKLDGRLLLQPIGFTSGWGHFHISDVLFEEMRGYLMHLKDPYATAFDFGKGPNWRIRVIKRTLQLLDLNPHLTRHGFSREVFFCPIASNSLEFLRGDHKRIRYGELPSVEEVSKLALERWIIPRAQRYPEFMMYQANEFLAGFTSLPSRQKPSRDIVVGYGLGK